MSTSADTVSHWQDVLLGVVAYPEISWRQPAIGVEARVEAVLPSMLEQVSTRLACSPDDVASVLWALLIARLTNQVGVVLATTAEGADGDDVLPLRFDFDTDTTIHAALTQMHAQGATDGARTGLSPDRLVDLYPSEGEGTRPVFLAGTGIRTRGVAELDLMVVDGNVVLRSATGAFASDVLRQMLEGWTNLVAGVSAGITQPLCRLPLLSNAQAQVVIEQGNDTAVTQEAVPAVHRLFEAQATRTPDAVALVHGQRRLSYAELNAQANQLARHLRQQGVGHDDRVAIYVDRGIEMVVGLLAVLKAGAAYVPLDPTYPADRLAFTLSDSAPRALLTMTGMQPPAAEVLGELPASLAVVELGTRDATWTLQPSHDLDETAAIGPASLAYVLYTSGSTGKPKGVAMPHGPLVNLIQWQAREPGNDVPLRTLQFAALGFDVAFQEVFATLSTGGTLIAIDQETRMSAGKLFELIVEQRVERMFLPYFALQMLAEGLEGHLAALPVGQRLECALREVITAGEQLRIEPKIVRFFEQLPGCRLHNHYGPTETHVVTALTLPEDPRAWPRLPTIGTPIANARVYVLDTQGQPLPHGVVGELYLAGPVVAQGYLHRDDLTAERFLRDPFAHRDGARMYRTGDLGRWLPDGTLEYLGRQDFQVKIRGFRVELGEIEAQVMAFPGVREAGVLAREDVPGLKRLVAYLAPQDRTAPVDVERLRRHLVGVLPDYMVPVAYVQMDTLPLSPNGKLDRAKLPQPGRGRPDWAGTYSAPRDATEAALCRIFADVLDLEELGRDDNFFDLGGTSLLAIRLLEAARRERLGDVPAMALFRAPTPAQLAAAMAGDRREPLQASRLSVRHDMQAHEPVAIVGMAGRFPGAATVEAFWGNLCAGRDSVSRFSADELDASIPEAQRAHPAYVPARGVFDDVDTFDAAFFGISPKEAELMDPQQRIFLELCWECIERAGHVPDATDVPVGVFAGMYNASYYQHNVMAHADLIDKVGAFQVMLGNEKDYIATRVAHKLNLTGPAISVHTACSTSLVAISQAIDSLRSGRCGMALAGGIAVTCPVRSGHVYQEGGMLSADGHTRSFDAEASGTVFSDGAAVVLLKRLSDAIADGNPIYALVRGAAVNNDGGQKASFTAPSSEGQAAVIAMAHADAGVDARSIGYVEAHGTATPLGDPIEIEGLTRAFRQATDDTGFCVVGSVKSNVGHLLMAAGAAGVIKAAYALRDGCLPPTAHFRQANPVIDFARTPFRVSGELQPWQNTDGQPRRAGVSSFGVGGTNAHVVMEEAPVIAPAEPAEGTQLLTVSARTPTALAEAATRLADHLENAPDANLADVAWTLAVGRKAFAHRIAVAADTPASAVAQLRSAEVTAAASKSRPAKASEVVFLFPGQGCQYAGMGRALHAREPAFRDAFDECARVLDVELGQDLRALVFGDDADALLPTAIMQPAIFSIEYSLARWWMAQGVVPSALIGHSVGEFVAATLAGVFTLPDALRLVARRGRLMQAQPSGAMLSVRLPVDSLLSRLPEALSLAAENAPGACVVAGPHEVVAAFQQQLESEGVACRALKTSHAFHSAMMDAVVPAFRAEVDVLQRSAPAIPIVSTASGQWLEPAQAVSADYWASHLREPVRFSRAIAQVLDRPGRVLVEMGPRATLSTLSRQQPLAKQHGIPAIASLGDQVHDEHAVLLAAFGQAWTQGVTLSSARLDHRGRRLRVRLPTYPFEKKRYWVEPPAMTASLAADHSAIATRSTQELPMSVIPAPSVPVDRRPRLVAQLREVFEDVAGFELSESDEDANFIELGLDSLMLTQVALQLQKTFPVKIAFRQLMGEYGSLDRLAAGLDAQLPAEPAQSASTTLSAPVAQAVPMSLPTASWGVPVAASMPADSDAIRSVIAQQMQLMSQQLALLAGAAPAMAGEVAPTAVAPRQQAVPAPVVDATPTITGGDEEAALAHTRYDLKKAFGAIARIDATGGTELDAHQRERLDGFIRRYTARTPKSKAYTQQHRGHMADPRVVTGFRPLTKEIVYQIVVERSKGSHVWDIDGHEYVDALNGFGTSLFGWQPDFVVDAVKQQIDHGYEIGPMHPLAGEVSQLVCELTGHDRAALCNTGSEAVLGAMRIARTATGRETIVVFSGSYHGINDEVIVRGTKKLRAVPAAPGILRNTAEKVLVLDYGTPETLEIIRERAHELAAVLVEPVQSRRPDFQPVEFLKEVRKITADAGAVLIFDEVITGFRSHPGGAQALFGIQADLCTYGKVVGGGYPIGVMAGKRDYMDALDGGFWQYGDDSTPPAGVTYFAGTFVRHPLTLAAAKASLLHMKEQGVALQQRLNERTAAMAAEVNAFCERVGAPLRIKHFASLWRTHFDEDHPLQDLLFAMMRSRGIHILDNFPCFFTTAHSEADFQAIIQAYKEAVLELQEARLLPGSGALQVSGAMDAELPSVPGARLGRDPEGRPGWYVADPDQPGQYLRVEA